MRNGLWFVYKMRQVQTIIFYDKIIDIAINLFDRNILHPLLRLQSNKYLNLLAPSNLTGGKLTIHPIV